MQDFSEFFVKEKPAIEACFACKSNAPTVAQDGMTFEDIFKTKKTRFFDIDKVFKDVE